MARKWRAGRGARGGRQNSHLQAAPARADQGKAALCPRQPLSTGESAPEVLGQLVRREVQAAAAGPACRAGAPLAALAAPPGQLIITVHLTPPLCLLPAFLPTALAALAVKDTAPRTRAAAPPAPPAGAGGAAGPLTLALGLLVALRSCWVRFGAGMWGGPATAAAAALASACSQQQRQPQALQRTSGSVASPSATLNPPSSLLLCEEMARQPRSASGEVPEVLCCRVLCATTRSNYVIRSPAL